MNEKINKFWNWFVANNERLTMLSEYSSEEQDKMLDELQENLTAYCEGLTFDMGEQTKNGRRAFVNFKKL